jgi:hypothetical protein
VGLWKGIRLLLTPLRALILIALAIAAEPDQYPEAIWQL